MRRGVAGFLASALILLAPGLRPYEAAAQVVRAAGAAGEAASAASAVGSLRLALPTPSLSPAPVLAPSVPLTAPSVAPALSAPAVAPAAVRAVPVVAVPAARAPVPLDSAALPRAAAALSSAARLPSTAVREAPAERQSSEASRLFDLAAARPADSLAVLAAPEDGPEKPSGLEPSKPSDAPAAKPAKTKLPKPLWGLFWGHDILTVFGIEMHMVSQPFLVMDTLKKSKAIMGLVRNVHMGSMSLANLLPVGLLIDKTDFRAIAIGTALIRAAIMGAIPLLFLAGHLSFAVLVAIVALNPLFQNTMIVAEGAARMAMLGTDEKLNKEASAVFAKWDSLAGILMPLIASGVVSSLVAHFGLGGYAFAYGVYAVLLLASVPVYWLTVRDPRDPKELGLKGFVEFLEGTRSFLWAVAKGIVLSPLSLYRALRGFLRRAKSAAPAPAGEKVGLKEKLARALDSHEAMQGFSYILRNKTLSTLISVGAIEAFLSDAMPMVVLPNFIKDVVGVGPHLPLLGGLLATAGGVFGVMLAAEAVGHFLAAWRMEGDRGDRLIEKVGHGRFYRMAAASSLLFWLMWLVPIALFPHAFWISLGAILFVQFATQIFHGPVGIVMAPVVRNEIPDDKLGRVESAFNMIDMFFSAGGALAAGFLLDWFSISTAMALIAVAITVSGVLEWMVPKWIFPDGNRPAKKSP